MMRRYKIDMKDAKRLQRWAIEVSGAEEKLQALENTDGIFVDYTIDESEFDGGYDYPDVGIATIYAVLGSKKTYLAEIRAYNFETYWLSTREYDEVDDAGDWFDIIMKDYETLRNNMRQEIKERIEKIRDGEVPEGYKKTKIGIIPDDWDVCDLIKYCSKISDGIHTTPEYCQRSNYYFINGNNLKNGSIIITDSTKCVTKEEYKKNCKDLNENSILMSINGTIGEVAFFKNEKVILGKSAAYINCIYNEDINFVYYNLQTQKTINFFLSELTGSTIKNLSLKSLKETPIPSPPVATEREKMASILSTWDKAIELKEKLIEQKKELKRGLMQKLLTGEVRFSEFNDEWKNKRILEVLDYEQPNGYIVEEVDSYDEKLTPVLTANKSFILGSTKDKEGIYNKIPAIIFDDFTTDCKYVDFPFKVKSSAMKILKAKKDCNLKFIYEVMKYIRFPLGEHKRYYISEYQYAKINMPSYEEQNKIADFSIMLDVNITNTERELQYLKQQKKGLMQLLLTGIVRVNTGEDDELSKDK